MNLWWGDKILVGWGESTRGGFLGGGMSKFSASREEGGGGLPPHLPQ